MTESSSKRGKVTPENQAESRALKAIWEAKKDKLGKTQEQFGEDYGIGVQSAVGNMLNGKMAISLKAAIGFAKGLGCDVSDFSKRIAAEISEIAEFDTESWPFPDLQKSRFKILTRDERLEIQGLARHLIERAEAARGNRKSA